MIENTTYKKRSGVASLVLAACALVVPPLGGAAAARAGEPATGKSFVETFDNLSSKRWYISDGWSNGDHQNCTWSKNQVRIADGVLQLTFQKQKYKDRDYVCGEIQTNQRFGYGTYEVRMKAAAGSGLNTGFFSYIGPVHKQPHDEIDFEVLGKNPAKVQINQFVNGKEVGDHKLVDVPGGADREFHDYAFVWEKDSIRWYVDGQAVGEATDPAKLPSHPSKIFVSLWSSDKLKSWMGPLAEFDGPITAEIDRIAFTAPGDACQFSESVACQQD